MILKIPNQDQRCGLTEYDKVASHDYWKAWTEIIQYHSFSVKDAKLRLKILSQLFWWME